MQIADALTVEGALVATGGLTPSGGVTGPDINAATVVAAKGAARASATNIAASAINVWITTTTSAQGARLPALVSGQSMWVWPMPTIGVKLYTAANQVLNALASATALQLASAKPIRIYTADAVHIRTMPVSA